MALKTVLKCIFSQENVFHSEDPYCGSEFLQIARFILLSNVWFQTFLTLPLYIGVESILGIAIINKLAGLYGVLSIFMGNSLDPMQWLFYLYSIVVVPFYVIGFKNITKPKVLEHAPIVVIYSIDTLVSLFYTLYFAAQWLIFEDVKLEIVPGQDYSQSATQGYEYGWIFFLTLAVNAARVYFTIVLLSFYKKLVKFKQSQGIDILENDIDLDLKSKPFYSQWYHKISYQSYRFLKDHL